MWNLIKSKKYYFIHGALTVAGFLTPSITEAAAKHPVYASGITLAWGWLLHYLDGKQQAAQW